MVVIEATMDEVSVKQLLSDQHAICSGGRVAVLYEPGHELLANDCVFVASEVVVWCVTIIPGESLICADSFCNAFCCASVKTR